MKTGRRGAAVFLLGTLGLLVAACAHYPLNARLTEYRADGGYRFDPLLADEKADELFVCLSFSGGGTRAAAFAYGVMKSLRETTIPLRGTTVSFLSEVDCISSVSGGSFTAAYYGLFGDRIFTEFEDRFLRRDIERELFWRVLSPINWARLASPYWSRIDLAAELYDETVFKERTFAELIASPRRPFIIMNATRLTNGSRFQFTQEEFDFLGSDLSEYKVARAVAASSAFPVLLSPLSLWSYPPPAGSSPPEDYVQALKSAAADQGRYYRALHRMELMTGDRKYIHLMDGGLADNIGLRTIMAGWESTDGFILRRMNDGGIKRLVVIAVNARTDPPEYLSSSERPPGLGSVAYKVATVSMENYSFDTVDLMRRLEQGRDQLQRTAADCQRHLDRSCPSAPPVDQLRRVPACIVEVSFEAIQPEGRRGEFLGLPTSFALSGRQVDALIQIGGELLAQNREFQKLLRALRGEPSLGAGAGEKGNCS
ncbi:MAG: patatin-like phospholipase family protein [Candidatus Rokubacteria bacterium]|nr:patatin-like phospholipase family protein [Candidatus Rokubacteria bacterium]